MHAGDDVESGQTPIGQFSIDEGLGDDADGLAAGFEDGVGQECPSNRCDRRQKLGPRRAWPANSRAAGRPLDTPADSECSIRRIHKDAS